MEHKLKSSSSIYMNKDGVLKVKTDTPTQALNLTLLLKAFNKVIGDPQSRTFAAIYT